MIQFSDQEVTFNIIDTMKFPSDVENCNPIESLSWDYCGEKVIIEIFSSKVFDIEFPEGVLEEGYIMSKVRKFKPLDLKTKGDQKIKPTIEEPSELELKSLPHHLKYAYMEENDIMPVIIFTHINSNMRRRY